MNTDAERGAGYAVLAQLLEHGAADVPPELAKVFDPSAVPETLRSEYVAAFDLGVPPFASAFLEADRCVGGRVTTAVGDRMGTAAGTGLAACHLASQLRYVAQLLAAGQWGPAKLFTHDVVLVWLPALSVVLDDQPVPFWRAVVRQALDLAADHAGRVAPQDWSMPLTLAELASPLGEKAGLTDIAKWFSTPAAVGTFISDEDLVGIGRAIDVPRGFGSRAQRIETLLRSAVDYGVVPRALEGLCAVLQRRKDALAKLSTTHVHPGLISPWVERLDTGLRVAATLSDAALVEQPLTTHQSTGR